MSDPRSAARITRLLADFGTSLRALGIDPDAVEGVRHVAGFRVADSITITHSGGRQIVVHDRTAQLKVER